MGTLSLPPTRLFPRSEERGGSTATEEPGGGLVPTNAALGSPLTRAP